MAEKSSAVYADIAKRTDGSIYIGVVGPVRTGKSTFIKKFMETLVLPKIPGEFRKARATDELPQSGGRRKAEGPSHRLRRLYRALLYRIF